MNIELLKDAAAMVAGKTTGPIVNLLYDKKNVNEFLIAKSLGLTINQTRNILYKLSDEGLVTFVRKKDKRKGWYTYFWTFNTDRALLLMQRNILKQIEELEMQLKIREVKRFYICPSCHTEVNEETALLNNFICPECGEVYQLNENKKAISEINSSTNRLKKQLEEINIELEIISGKKHVKMVRQIKKAEKDKKDRRRVAQLERRKLADKEKKISGKKLKKTKEIIKKKISGKKLIKKSKKKK